MVQIVHRIRSKLNGKGTSQFRLFNTVVAHSELWEQIKPIVTHRAQMEFGELYLESNGEHNQQFNALLNKYSLDQVRMAQDKYQQISQQPTMC